MTYYWPALVYIPVVAGVVFFAVGVLAWLIVLVRLIFPPRRPRVELPRVAIVRSRASYSRGLADPARGHSR